jgi:EAL domain-containing protein (putative c-di-GMP-specific phosphodiesterase class I)
MSTSRSIRRFKPDPIPDGVLDQLLAAAIQAPNGSNLQSWHFMVIRDPEKRRQVGELYRQGFRENFPADRLKLEITETVFFEDHDRAYDILQRLRETGVETDIDDFGTGYSNLAYLVRLPISTLKIDKSFVMLMAENPANREVITTIISLAGNLGFRGVA